MLAGRKKTVGFEERLQLMIQDSFKNLAHSWIENDWSPILVKTEIPLLRERADDPRLPSLREDGRGDRPVDYMSQWIRENVNKLLQNLSRYTISSFTSSKIEVLDESGYLSCPDSLEGEVGDDSVSYIFSSIVLTDGR